AQSEGGGFGSPFLTEAKKNREFREALASAVKDTPVPSEAEFLQARDQLDRPIVMPLDAFLTPLVVTSFLALAAIPLAFILRGSPLLLLSGITLQTADGRPAGRLLCLLRSFLAWGLF